jgi:hypothetical protein
MADPERPKDADDTKQAGQTPLDPSEDEGPTGGAGGLSSGKDPSQQQGGGST